ncbi:erythroferrone isoform X2 [Phycodurus eques]|uniref:erythroferrone isoform X2 n=1 Tax=Phycodurus eques TaxID=693459 RepID=UPI002ACD6EFE|nr:erythroferrone isoform X2 [Phycodurus eques]
MTGPSRKTRPIGSRCHLIMMMVMMMMMMMMMVMVMVSSSQEVQDDGVVQDSTPSEGSPLSPRSTWMMFMKNSQAQKRNSRRTAKGALRGPPGPRGPPGLPCPPAPRPHPQQILDDVLSELAGGVSFCALCHRPPRIPASFLGFLRRTVEVARRSLTELRPFTQAPPSFQRGTGFNVSDGRYTAMLKSGERVQVRLCESVTAAVCVGSLCRTNLSIESVVGVASVGGAFSISLTGMLFLQAGEYASVYVDNAAGADVSVTPDSFFSAILLGI